MAQPIYKVFLFKMKDSYYQLTQEERDKLMAKGDEIRKKVGGEAVIACVSLLCSENWLAWGVEKFPDIEAAQKHAQLLWETDWYKYFDAVSYLGTEMAEG